MLLDCPLMAKFRIVTHRPGKLLLGLPEEELIGKTLSVIGNCAPGAVTSYD